MTNTTHSEASTAIERALDAIPGTILARSGSLFYSGTEAFQKSRPLYILGLNPGGDPAQQAANTVGRHLDVHRARTEHWSAYKDDSWEGLPPGTAGLQPRILHLLAKAGLDPRLVPASNVVFVRTVNEAALKAEKAALLEACWPVHQAVIDSLKVRVVLCMGSTAGRWVREKLNAHVLVDEFHEANDRRWKSEAYRSPDGRIVITTSHPGRADWRNPSADPSGLVIRALSACGTAGAAAPAIDVGPPPISGVATTVPRDLTQEIPATSQERGDRDGTLGTIQKTDPPFRELETKISSEPTRAAHRYLVQNVLDLGLTPSGNSGHAAAVRLHDDEGRYLYSWIPNRAHLTFYLRKPALTERSTLKQQVLASELVAAENVAGELKVRIETEDNARKLLRILASD